MEVNALTWIITIVVVIGFFVFDFFTHVRTPHEPTLKESALWSAFYIALAMAFGVFLWLNWGEPGNPHQHGIEFFAGYITEKALSIDNLFIFSLILVSFKIPRKYQQKVLLIGILLALGLRGIFIWLGAAVIEAWSDVFYLFGIFLLWTAAKLAYDEITGAEETDLHDMKVIKVLRKVIPVTDKVESDRLFVREHELPAEEAAKAKANSGKKKTKKGKGHLMVTPLFVALLAIGFIDVLFALDSIPAIYGITEQPYIVFTTNALALMGLRQLFFLLDGLLDKLVYLSYGLSVILAFIGVKLVLHALHENNLPFINGGEGLPVPEVSVEFSLIFIVATLAVTTILSLTVGKKAQEKKQAEQQPGAEQSGQNSAEADRSGEAEAVADGAAAGGFGKESSER